MQWAPVASRNLKLTMVEDLLRAAELAFQKGDLGRASQLCSEILRDAPGNEGALRMDGMIACRQGRLQQAIDRLSAVTSNDYLALTWLQAALRGVSRYQEAIEVGLRSQALWPDDPEVSVNLGLAYRGARDVQQAVACFTRAAELQPSNPLIHHHLGVALKLLGEDGRAADAFREAIRIAPREEMAYTSLAKLMMEKGNYVQALDLCQEALKLLPRSAPVHMLAAHAYRSLKDQGPADHHLKAAISLDPKNVLTAAFWSEQDGRFEEAASLFRQSIRIKPVQGQAYAGLTRAGKVTDRDLLLSMERLAGSPELPAKEKSSLHYGLGKAYNDLGRFEEAMVQFDAANRIIYDHYLAGRTLDPDKARTQLEAMARTFSAEFIERNRSVGSESRKPIFIVGMIRSGTTLVEQIISSHREVSAAGEQQFWLMESPRAVDLTTQTLDAVKFREMQDRYLRILSGFAPDSPRVTDKMPGNFYLIGLIHLAFPNSPIVHVRRNPVDNALSIYMTEFGAPSDLSHNKRRIVDSYRLYLDTMRHWRAVIPAGNLLEIRYEDLVSDQEGMTRRIIEFCGLEWDPACLEFHASPRSVSTPSLWQVRQPIYRTSVEKWRNYEPWLGEFGELL